MFDWYNTLNTWVITLKDWLLTLKGYADFKKNLKRFCSVLNVQSLKPDDDSNIWPRSPVFITYFVLLWQAKECLQHALSFKRHEITFIMLGKINLMEGNMQAAVDIYKQAVEWDLLFWLLFFYLFVCLFVWLIIYNCHILKMIIDSKLNVTFQK